MFLHVCVSVFECVLRMCVCVCTMERLLDSSIWSYVSILDPCHHVLQRADKNSPPSVG